MNEFTAFFAFWFDPRSTAVADRVRVSIGTRVKGCVLRCRIWLHGNLDVVHVILGHSGQVFFFQHRRTLNELPQRRHYAAFGEQNVVFELYEQHAELDMRPVLLADFEVVHERVGKERLDEVFVFLKVFVRDRMKDLDDLWVHVVDGAIQQCDVLVEGQQQIRLKVKVEAFGYLLVKNGRALLRQRYGDRLFKHYVSVAADNTFVLYILKKLFNIWKTSDFINYT